MTSGIPTCSYDNTSPPARVAKKRKFMPYRVRGTTVQVLVNGLWKVVKEHLTRTAAFAHMKALESNVKHKSKAN